MESNKMTSSNLLKIDNLYKGYLKIDGEFYCSFLPIPSNFTKLVEFVNCNDNSCADV